ncbi:hypothetical protein L9F63_015022, partial [Diploptera punctata]
GSFLLKMFTLYEYETICLIYFLCCAFTSVRVNKPATSKEGNSEVYVVCLEYRGIDVMEPWLSVLRKHFVPVKAMFPHSDIPKDFLDQLYECATIFKNYQTDVIETNIRVYEGFKRKGEDYIIKKIRHLIPDYFLEKYEMKKLDPEDEVVGKDKLRKTMTLNMDPRSEEGSFDDRRKKAVMEPLELLKVLKEELLNIDIDWPHKDVIGVMNFPDCVNGFEIKIGKPVKTVQSSKFCLGRLLKTRNDVRKVARGLLSRSNSNRSDASSTAAANNNDNLAQESELSLIVRDWLKKEHGKSDLKILNYKEKLWTSMETGNEEAELNAFWDIMDVIDDIWRDQSLLLQGYPMLTQFNVGIVYMLCHLFEEVGFVKPNKQDFGIVFCHFRKWNPKMKKFLDEVDTVIQKLQDEGGKRTVLSLFPVNKLCERYSATDTSEKESSDAENKCEDGRMHKCEDNLFYKSVTEVNHLCVKEQVLDIIHNVLH